MPNLSRKPKQRPSYPSAARQWHGFLLTVLLIVIFEVIAANFGPLRSPGSILLLGTMFISYWSGLRTGILTSVLSLAYLTYAYSDRGHIFHYSGLNGARLLSAGIFIPGFALLVGSIQGRMRNAAIREFDAREAAGLESAHRLQTEDALRSSEELRRVVVEAAMDAIVAVRGDGNITLWNKAAETVFGWRSEEVIGKPLVETIIPPGYREPHLRGFAKFRDTGQASVVGRKLELTALNRSGEEFPVELNIVKHDTSEGPIFIGFVHDVTEQKKLTEHLRQAQKMEAIGRLAGGIAHDFNNILAAISGNVVLARADVPSTSSAQASLSEIEKAVSRATHVVRQILTFSSVKESNAEVIDVGETIQEALQLLRATLPASIAIRTEFEPGLPPIKAGGTDIHQMILNLGINAQHAMQEGGGVLEVSARRRTLDAFEADSLVGLLPGEYVEITFKDSGCGMDSHTLSRLFEPFFTTRPTGEGTGLGLSVVHGIVQRHSGAITVSSEPGAGTEFHIYFPTVPALAGNAVPPVLNPEQGHGERVLYIDDDEALVFMMQRVLSRLNYAVSGFDDPREALEAFRANPDDFDLVITDMSMPYIDGPAMVRELQAIRPEVPIVMVTGYIRPDDLERARHLGVRELLLKPNTVHEMADVIHGMMSEISRRESVGSRAEG